MSVPSTLCKPQSFTQEELKEAKRFLKSTLVWDNHACMPLRWNDMGFMPELERLQKIGVDVITLNIGYGEQTIEEHVRSIAAFRNWLKSQDDKYYLAQSLSDIDTARQQGKLAVLFDIEGTRGIGDQVSLIEMYYDLGVRWMLMAYNRRNLVGGGVHDDNDVTGLTDFGRDVISEMERTGMVVCCSHTHPKTALDVMSYARNPVIFSHSNAAEIWSHPRNISNELAKACAEKGGVIGINGVGSFLGQNDTSSETVVRHIDHFVTLLGVDHVGIALDYVFDRSELADALKEMQHTFPDDPAYKTTPDFVQPEQITEIVILLKRLGYHDTDLAKILGQNHRRIAEQCWK